MWLDTLKYALLKSLVILIYVVSHVYDYVSYPIYFLYYKPWRVRRYRRALHSTSTDSEMNAITYESVHQTLNSASEDMFVIKGVSTMCSAFHYVTDLHADRECLGTRQILSEEDEIQPNTKRVFKKFILGDYRFCTYREFAIDADLCAKGFRALGIAPKTRIAILAETRREWMVSTYGAFINNLTLVTLYTNLGEESIKHGLTETEVPLLICSDETLPKVKKTLKFLPFVKNIVVFESSSGKKTDLETDIPSGVKAITFSNLLKMGEADDSKPYKEPEPEDIAIMMYTSGSTGTPKGVLLSHHNLVQGIKALLNIATLKPTDRYIAYLPLAHVLELLSEMACLVCGIKIGYSSPLTLTNKSSKVKAGCKGDANVFRPTLMCSVPLILERIYKSVVDTMKRQGWAAEELFHYFVQYKMKWQDRGFDTPLLNKTLFRKIRYFLGGRVRLMLSGGAPLSPDTHSLTRTCICVPLVQAYGLTETTACATVTDEYDRTTGRAGVPLVGLKFKLVNWDEGNYLVTDKPFPRGEIHIGGETVSVGYFKNPEKTQEEFYKDENGIRWFRTGDIAQMENDGVIRIIDRKKDLVKLQGGEYLSYGKIESTLKTCPIVENICVHADPSKDYLFAVVIPDKNHLDADSNISDPQVYDRVMNDITNFGIKNGLLKFEIPGKALLVNDEWTADNGLVTAAYKIRRRNIIAKYKDEIEALYN